MQAKLHERKLTDTEDGKTAGFVYREAVDALRAAGVESAALDARVLLAHVLGVDAAWLIAAPDDVVPGAARARFTNAIARRRAGEPVARIVGAKEFWSRSYSLSASTLVPRPETETLIEAALQMKPERSAPLRILDLGTGSGILLGALLLEYPRASGAGIDIDAEAARTVHTNLESLGVGERACVVCGHWAQAIGARFDLVVSNPPYVASGDVARLPVEVRAHDPLRALDGGADGLDSYRAILSDLGRLLAPAGVAILELGEGQERAVADIARYAQIEVNGPARRDLSGHPRALVLGRAD